MVMATETKGRNKLEQDLRLRRPSPSPTLVSSLSESSLSDCGHQDHSSNTLTVGRARARPPPVAPADRPGLTLRAIVASTFVRRRLSCQSSLPWGHRPSPLVGASCLLFLLPVPYLLRACQPGAALIMLGVTASSYLSDHVYTGLPSRAHAVDRAWAPLAFAACLRATYATCGARWASLSLAALLCHARASYCAKRGMYEGFVVWHSLWHLVGVGTIVVCFTVNGRVGQCWEGSGWEEFFMNFS